MLRECLYCKLNAIYWYQNIQSDGLLFLFFLFLSTKKRFDPPVNGWRAPGRKGGGREITQWRQYGNAPPGIFQTSNFTKMRPLNYRHETTRVICAVYKKFIYSFIHSKQEKGILHGKSTKNLLNENLIQGISQNEIHPCLLRRCQQLDVSGRRKAILRVGMKQIVFRPENSHRKSHIMVKTGQ